MNRDEIKQYLPHREPMLLVDEMTLDENHVAHSRYHVTGEEFFLKGHFPGEPVVPGVILCEIMAQSCALLMKDDLIGKLTFYTGIDKVRFKNSVKPGDRRGGSHVDLSSRQHLHLLRRAQRWWQDVRQGRTLFRLAPRHKE